MGEDRFYKPLCKWLEKEKAYFCGGQMYFTSSRKEKWYINTGSVKQKVDVAGVKNIGSRHFDQVETVAVEVRDVRRITVRDLQDAQGYSNMAHRCYLATTAEIMRSDEDDARRMGIGLIQILKRDKYREILGPGRNEPNDANLIEFLHNLWVIQCTLCRCYAFQWDKVGDLEGKSYFELKRARQFDFALSDSRSTAFEALDSKDMPSGYQISRYVCRSCVQDLAYNFPRWAKSIEKD